MSMKAMLNELTDLLVPIFCIKEWNQLVVYIFDHPRQYLSLNES